ncbi:MAG TPA: inner membrane CreD family protein [Phycisphaerae bacterium]|nr:inner membrane CreD family protein [Phycisphaerae bacterium]HUT57725.1 inner membrane CreD family protein [Phycisphaerae bacterium]
MSVLRFFAIVVIFGAVSVAWFALGGSVWVRTEDLDYRLSREMNSLLGPEVLAQPAPYLARTAEGSRTDSDVSGPAASEITADIKHQHRYKGLLWYSMFTLAFHGEYHTAAEAAAADAPNQRHFVFPLPRDVKAYDGLRLAVDEANIPVRQPDIARGRIVVALDTQKPHTVTIDYATTGREVWVYAPGDVPERPAWEDERVLPTSGPLTELRNFSLTVTTNFSAIDYPKGSRSPSAKAEPSNGGMTAWWRYASALTNQAMGVVMPTRPQAGPITARMSFFAPVSLLFFFCVLFTVVVLKKIPLHPMHYLFIASGFFAFHILMAYLADVIDIHAAFWVCAAVSVLLVVSYMRLVAGVKFALLFVGLAQLVYLVGFSYAFFWVGRTGLTVTVGAVITLFLLMQATGRVNWFEVFKRRNSLPPPMPPAQPGSAGDPTAHPEV